MGLLKNTLLRNQKEKLQTGNSHKSHLIKDLYSLYTKYIKYSFGSSTQEDTQLDTEQRIIISSKKIYRDRNRHKKLSNIISNLETPGETARCHILRRVSVLEKLEKEQTSKKC